MPVFETKNLDRESEDLALLAAILHPTRAARTRAVIHGRRRAKRAMLMADPMTVEGHFPQPVDDIVAAAPIPAV